MALSMSSGLATPSCTMRMASSAIATASRDEAKPGASLTTTAVFPRSPTHPRAASTVSCEVCSATTTSMRVEAGTGLKKCRPNKCAGRDSEAAKPVTERDDVLVARYA